MKKGCWKWGGYHRKSDGRPMAGRHYAYRLIYEAAFGVDLPADTILHHRCKNLWCVNPMHLACMTQGEHLHAHGLPGDNHQALKTHCPAGHPYTAENTYYHRGERSCRTCRLNASRRFRERHR